MVLLIAAVFLTLKHFKGLPLVVVARLIE